MTESRIDVLARLGGNVVATLFLGAMALAGVALLGLTAKIVYEAFMYGWRLL